MTPILAAAMFTLALAMLVNAREYRDLRREVRDGNAASLAASAALTLAITTEGNKAARWQG